MMKKPSIRRWIRMLNAKLARKAIARPTQGQVCTNYGRFSTFSCSRSPVHGQISLHVPRRFLGPLLVRCVFPDDISVSSAKG